MSMRTVLNSYLSENEFHSWEGNKGLEQLNELCNDIGYGNDGFRFGSPLEHFLADNPGAIEAILSWISNQVSSEWSDNLESFLRKSDAVCEMCGTECEYDSDVCLCKNCENGLD